MNVVFDPAADRVGDTTVGIDRQVPSDLVCFAAARFSVRFSFSDLCAGFLPIFFGFSEPFIA